MALGGGVTQRLELRTGLQTDSDLGAGLQTDSAWEGGVTHIDGFVAEVFDVLRSHVEGGLTGHQKD